MVNMNYDRFCNKYDKFLEMCIDVLKDEESLIAEFSADSPYITRALTYLAPNITMDTFVDADVNLSYIRTGLKYEVDTLRTLVKGWDILYAPVISTRYQLGITYNLFHKYGKSESREIFNNIMLCCDRSIHAIDVRDKDMLYYFDLFKTNRITIKHILEHRYFIITHGY